MMKMDLAGSKLSKRSKNNKKWGRQDQKSRKKWAQNA